MTTLQSKSSVRVDGQPIHVDPELLFQRLIVASSAIGDRKTSFLWAAVFTFNPYLLISINELMISIIHLLISINELLISINDLLISINELLISINTSSSTVFIDINNSFIDINKGIIDINNSFIDINKYGWRCHIY